MSTICIYHANCVDGFGAAWAVRRWAQKLGRQIEFVAGVYGSPPPDVAGKDVIMVDFSYKRPVIECMAASAQSILIVDHHESARDDLRGYGPAPGPGKVTCKFDMGRSGAGLAWDFFHQGAQRPRLIDHIEDRDLWRFALPGTREIQAAVFSYPYDFDVWDNLMSRDLAELETEGRALERKRHKDTAELVRATQRRMTIGGVSIPVANIPHIFTSDAGHMMSDGEPFAACYWDTPDGRAFSLRSRDDGANVAEIAAQYGGGGHAHAAGFRMPIGWEGEK
jgi:oligoribonuclease NrnB/cAMP/cGMP phosphodiesterase (DHH superfamily)